jgi:hypothetical protein
MDNIINFQGFKNKKPVGPLTSKEMMLKVVDEMRELIEEGKLTGIAAVGMGSDNKIFSILAGEFDIILAIGGIESMKHMMLAGSEIMYEDD